MDSLCSKHRIISPVSSMYSGAVPLSVGNAGNGITTSTWTWTSTWTSCHAFINKDCQLRAYKYPHPKLGKRIWFNAGVHDLPHIVHLHNVVATVITGRVANNIQRRPLNFLDHPCCFCVSKVMFQFPNNSRNEHFHRWRKSNQWPMFLFEIYLK